ncbi:Bifunctional inhibitor/plant lipid transfer protein/seed storage helical domain containing protein [Trema orientale]|uniref:Bifunctional inhibitor/plant lipid transfer protein/seed storage helical domain containing protein n=1 Tax=Trema orientale TaxID=63057 RepID=A0A2P5F9L5_TREOI|nr:Bifunctional inhibitor/plant lipid transfer protein/seed storage helical domain containing protein [Trema orientale]
MSSPISILLLIFVVALSPVALSQDTTVAECAPRLLPLAPCGAFVQGSTQSPAQSCCDNLKQIYGQQPRCLCLLLNDTTLSSLPINSTLALQLPTLCSLQVDISVCSGTTLPSPPGSQVSLGSRDTNSSSTAVNSTIAASPMIQTVPRSPNTAIGYGLSKSESFSLKTGSYLTVVMAAALVTYVLG